MRQIKIKIMFRIFHLGDWIDLVHETCCCVDSSPCANLERVSLKRWEIWLHYHYFVNLTKIKYLRRWEPQYLLLSGYAPHIEIFHMGALLFLQNNELFPITSVVGVRSIFACDKYIIFKKATWPHFLLNRNSQWLSSLKIEKAFIKFLKKSLRFPTKKTKKEKQHFCTAQWHDWKAESINILLSLVKRWRRLGNSEINTYSSLQLKQKQELEKILLQRTVSFQMQQRRGALAIS